MRLMKKSFLFSLVSATLLLFGCANQPNVSVLPSSEAPLSSDVTLPASSPTEGSSKSVPAASEASSEAPISSSSEAPISSESTYTPSIKGWEGVNFDEYGETFRNTLGKLIKGDTTSYSNCLHEGARVSVLPLTAEIPTSSSGIRFVPFYKAPTEANLTTTSACNREHTWPDSRGGNLIENDPIVIRPTLSKDNTARGNENYGTVSPEWDPASCGYEAARGESARVILYAATRYGKEYGLKLYNNKVKERGMGTLKTLLYWNRTYAPSAFERKVNERYAELGYARNPFVDYPAFADYIWDNLGFRTTPYRPTEPPVGYSEEPVSSLPPEVSSSSSPEISFPATLTITGKSSGIPSAYDKSETERTVEGIRWNFYCAATFDSGNTIQVKNREGYFYNLDALNYDSMKITMSGGGLYVYGGSSSNPEDPLEKDDETGTYDISNCPFIKIASNNGGVANISSIAFA